MKQKTKNSIRTLNDYMQDLTVIRHWSLDDNDGYSYNVFTAEYYRAMSKLYLLLVKDGFKEII